MDQASPQPNNHPRIEFNHALDNVREALKNLHEFVNRNDADLRDKLGDVHLLAKGLDEVIYGNAKRRTRGIIERVENLESLVESIEDARREERATLKGIKIGLALTGLTGAGTLISILAQILGGS